MHKMC